MFIYPLHIFLMENDTNPSSETLADGAHVTPADGGETVGTAASTLAELNKILGGNFKDLPSALKAVSDTKAFVGKRKEDILAEARLQQSPAPEVASAKIEENVKQLENRLFFSENPQYKGYEKLIASMGQNPAEVVNSDAFKEVFEKVKVADEIEQKKSVVNSSPRLAQSKNGLEEAVKIANSRGTDSTTLAEHLAKTILEATEDQG